MLLSNFIEVTLWHLCLPVNLLYIFKPPFHKNIDGGLFLYKGDLRTPPEGYLSLETAFHQQNESHTVKNISFLF